MGDLQQAANNFERSLTHNPENFPNYLCLASTYAHLGREKEAREALDSFFSRLGGGKPIIRVLMFRYPFRNPEVAERLVDGLLKAGIEGKPSDYYKILEENRLTGEEIRKLVFGREMQTQSPMLGLDYVNRAKDGTFKHARYGPGKSRIVDDMLCDKWDSRFQGLEYCGTVFRNPEGIPDTKDEYLYVTDFQILELSPVEGPASRSYKILEENRLSGEEIRKLLFGRTITGISPGTEMQWWIESSKDGKKIKLWTSAGHSDSGTWWLEGDLRCMQLEKLYSGTKACSHIYRNPDGTSEKKNEYLTVGKVILPFSPIN
jgi:hypothetical protein